jgi:secreted trypsin-like serine protease
MCVCIAFADLLSNRIVNGIQTTAQGQFPWQAAIFVGSNFCGGSLLNNNYVLTAGQCPRNLKKFVRVALG